MFAIFVKRFANRLRDSPISQGVPDVLERYVRRPFHVPLGIRGTFFRGAPKALGLFHVIFKQLNLSERVHPGKYYSYTYLPPNNKLNKCALLYCIPVLTDKDADETIGAWYLSTLCLKMMNLVVVTIICF